VVGGPLLTPGITVSPTGNSTKQSGNPLQKALLYKDRNNLKSSLFTIKTVNLPFYTFLHFPVTPRGYTGGRDTFLSGNNGEKERKEHKNR